MEGQGSNNSTASLAQYICTSKSKPQRSGTCDSYVQPSLEPSRPSEKLLLYIQGRPRYNRLNAIAMQAIISTVQSVMSTLGVNTLFLSDHMAHLPDLDSISFQTLTSLMKSIPLSSDSPQSHHCVYLSSHLSSMPRVPWPLVP